MFLPFTPYTPPKCLCLHRISNFALAIFFFIVYSLKKLSFIVDKYPIRLILVNSSAEQLNFFTHGLDSLLHFFPCNVEPLSSNNLLSSLSLCFFLIFLFSSKLFTKSKSRLCSITFPSNRLFHQGSFFVFGSLLAPTDSVTYAAAAYIVLFSSVRFQISIF